ncbi:carboxylate--amine ligase [Salinirubellus salinus]|uniref:Carboxylate--amine ligase n=1 Tax=Salinirubellus salinus TaxID=1364945 RepID=A0A9E7R4A3_9EURY|nr:carboxylate--amine ligase [Salinirubellus salinus]UWM54400.1 carboxylate--amine ligase [Salinirubellus salinus]
MRESRSDRPGVVVPTGHDPASYTCVRSLAKRGIHTIVASEKHPPAAASRFCGEEATLPPPRDDILAYRDALLELAARPSVRTVVPVRPDDVYVLSKFRGQFTEHVSLPLLPFDRLQGSCDRMRLVDAAQEAGVPVPRTRLLTDDVDIDRPSIVKSRYNILVDEHVATFGPSELDVVKRFWHVSPEEQIDWVSIRREMRHTPIVQDFVRHDDMYVFGALYDRGEPLVTFQHRQIRGKSYTGGGGVYRESVSNPELEAVGRRLLDHLEWHGPACIEYMREEETGEYVLTEINPRMWQSLPTAVLAGADFPYYYWLLATGRPEEVRQGYELGVGTHQLYGELGYLDSIRHDDSLLVTRPSLSRAALSVLVSCVTDPHFDVLHLDDPSPFVSGVAKAVRKLPVHKWSG